MKRRAMYNTGPAPFIKRIFPSLGESEELGTNLAVSEVGTITFSCLLTPMGTHTRGSRDSADSLHGLWN